MQHHPKRGAVAAGLAPPEAAPRSETPAGGPGLQGERRTADSGDCADVRPAVHAPLVLSPLATAAGCGVHAGTADSHHGPAQGLRRAMEA